MNLKRHIKNKVQNDMCCCPQKCKGVIHSNSNNIHIKSKSSFIENQKTLYSNTSRYRTINFVSRSKQN